jgi:hypothetical protein
MRNLKEKVVATAEQMRNAVTKTAGKVSHAATEALGKGDRALSKAAHKVKDLAVEGADKIKNKGGKAQDAANGVGDKVTGAGEETNESRYIGCLARRGLGQARDAPSEPHCDGTATGKSVGPQATTIELGPQVPW